MLTRARNADPKRRISSLFSSEKATGGKVNSAGRIVAGASGAEIQVHVTGEELLIDPNEPSPGHSVPHEPTAKGGAGGVLGGVDGPV